ncbi:MAG: hypothetical protein KC476_03815 [Cyanobacteria bacterium HKST-UBA06]|nr:hypothetical protein [Cyanobacteria bacterium HKST-UBA05]MCA9807060.1 hypothetical protein [Cyanobacteria bacterium HKST-UBA06]
MIHLKDVFGLRPAVQISNPAPSGASSQPFSKASPFETGVVTKPAPLLPTMAAPMSAVDFSQRDVFFSDQSTRAIVSRFVFQKNTSDGLFLSFGQPNSALPVWDVLARPDSDMVLAAIQAAGKPGTVFSPVKTEQTHPVTKQPVLEQVVIQGKDTPTARSLTLAEINPAAFKPSSKTDQPSPFLKPAAAEPEATTSPIKKRRLMRQVMLHHVKGRVLPADQFQALEQAFKTQYRDPSQPSWVARPAGGADPYLLKADMTPAQLGYRKLVHPLKAGLNKVVGSLLESWLKLPRIEAGWQLPNGAILEAEPGHWVNPAGQPVDLMQVAKAANGQWVRINRNLSQRQIPYGNKKLLSLSIQNILGPLQSSGAVRQYPAMLELPPLPAMPSIALPADAANRSADSRSAGQSPFVPRSNLTNTPPSDSGVTSAKAQATTVESTRFNDTFTASVQPASVQSTERPAAVSKKAANTPPID